MRLAESATQSKPAPLSEELGHVVLISPWVTDLPIHTSGLKGEEWRSILGGGLRSINTLSERASSAGRPIMSHHADVG